MYSPVALLLHCTKEDVFGRISSEGVWSIRLMYILPVCVTTTCELAWYDLTPLQCQRTSTMSPTSLTTGMKR